MSKLLVVTIIVFGLCGSILAQSRVVPNHADSDVLYPTRREHPVPRLSLSSEPRRLYRVVQGNREWLSGSIAQGRQGCFSLYTHPNLRRVLVRPDYIEEVENPHFATQHKPPQMEETPGAEPDGDPLRNVPWKELKELDPGYDDDYDYNLFGTS